MDAVFASFSHVLDVVSAFLSSVSPATKLVIASVVSVVIDVLCRVTKTDKPKSIAHGFAALIKGVGVLFTKAGAVASTLASKLDEILPQNLAS